MNLLPGAPSMANDEPLYNIGVVTRMTGVSMATLRAWERRYNFPDAGRSVGGHRLYSERDIMQIRWVKERIDDGMQTAQAIQALRRQEESGQVEEVDFRKAGQAGNVLPSTLENYQAQLVNVLVQHNLEAADVLLGEALAFYAPERLITDVIGPAMAAIGDAWEREQISVSTEHLATNYLRQRLLLWMVSGPPERDGAPLVLACAPGEWHEGSLLMLGALLRRQRYAVAYLGQDVPLADLAEFVKEVKPGLIVVVAMIEETALELLDWPRHMPDAARGMIPFGYAGRIFVHQPEWQLRMPGIYLGNTLETGVSKIEEILHNRM